MAVPANNKHKVSNNVLKNMRPGTSPMVVDRIAPEKTQVFVLTNDNVPEAVD